MLLITTFLFGLVVVASAGGDTGSERFSLNFPSLGLSDVLTVVSSLIPTFYDSTESYVTVEPTLESEPSLHVSYSNSITYVTETVDGETFAYTESTCSLPPTDIDICLTSIFSTMETELMSIVSRLRLHEASIQVLMHHEHTLLYSEISWVYLVESIASSVRSAIEVNYNALYIQLHQLMLEEVQIAYAYEVLEAQLNLLYLEAHAVIEQQLVIYAKYEYVRVAKWSLYSAISAIVYEKLVIEQEQNMIEVVIETLAEEISAINYKISELNHRQEWLVSWEVKLYADLHEFQYHVQRFKNLEVELVAREASLYVEQYNLLVEVANVQVALEQLRAEYVNIEAHLHYLEVYQQQLQVIVYSVQHEAGSFQLAYSQFTCQDSLLYYLACTKTAYPVLFSTAAP